MKKEVLSYLAIIAASALYGIGTVFFIFSNSVLLGGTSGISIILSRFLPSSPGTIITIINIGLVILSFIFLGREMAIKSFVGSILTTLFISAIEIAFPLEGTIVENNFLSAAIGASIIAFASAILFSVGSSSGGTDIIALIVQKFAKIDIGRAMLISDVLIVIVGGVISGLSIALSSALGFLVKVIGIDLIIGAMRRVSLNKAISKDTTPEGQNI